MVEPRNQKSIVKYHNSDMKLSHYLLFGIALLLGLGAVLAAVFVRRPYTYKGSLIDPAAPAADFTLTDQHGQTFRLSDQRGDVVLLFFGYTNCPDECPATMANFKQIKTALGDKANRVRFVMVTVDPQRDTSRQLGEFMDKFDPSFIGLTGTLPQLQTVWKDYWVSETTSSDSGGAASQDEHAHDSGAASYQVGHSTYVYAIDVNGNLRLTYALGTDSQLMAQDVSHLLDEKITPQ
jgi:protein SCO1/2